MSEFKIEGRTAGGRCVFRAVGIKGQEAADKLLEIALHGDLGATEWDVTGATMAPECRVSVGAPMVVPRLEKPPEGWTLVVLGADPDHGINPLQGLCMQSPCPGGNRLLWFNQSGETCGVNLRADADRNSVDAAFAWLAFELLRRHLQP
jgi:hypothetical protein